MARYLYPAAPVIYLIFGICISRLPWEKVLCSILAAALLICNIPQDINAYETRQERQEGLNAFLSEVVPSEDALLVSNDSHLPWTLFDYYYPGIDSMESSDPLSCLNGEYTEIWIFWTESLDEILTESAAECGYETALVHEGVFSNGSYYYAYRLIHS